MVALGTPDHPVTVGNFRSPWARIFPLESRQVTGSSTIGRVTMAKMPSLAADVTRVVGGLSGSGEVERDPAIIRPRVDGTRQEFSAVIDSDRLRPAVSRPTRSSIPRPRVALFSIPLLSTWCAQSRARTPNTEFCMHDCNPREPCAHGSSGHGQRVDPRGRKEWPFRNPRSCSSP